MPLKNGESHSQYKARVIDSVSKSFCAAKWYNSTIWLSNGFTASCHHPPAHSIDVNELKINPSGIHNTTHKKKMRELMLLGERPSECEYCWKIEDMDKDHTSDRVFKTSIYKDEDIELATQSDPYENVVPKTLEIAFDRVCNFACCYCNPTFSTTWVKDIRTNGPYRGLSTDKRNHFTHTHSDSDPYRMAGGNPYIEAFWTWWPVLSKQLDELRITGGEPLLSPHLWKILDHFSSDLNLNLRLAINSNLGASPQLIDQLISKSHSIKYLDIYTSCEAFGDAAEYLRDGLNFTNWCSNLEKLLASESIQNIHIMMTISSLCLFSITAFMDLVLDWKNKIRNGNPKFSLNILRFPTFQSPLVLPEHIRKNRAQEIRNWLNRNLGSPFLSDFEIASTKRLIDYLELVQKPTESATSREELAADLKRFFTQYDQRRKKNIRSAFCSEFLDWFDSIPS